MNGLMLQYKLTFESHVLVFMADLTFIIGYMPEYKIANKYYNEIHWKLMQYYSKHVELQ